MSYTVLLQLDRIPVWVFLIIIGREFAVTSLRAIASARGIVIKARDVGKYKMVFQFIGGGCLLHWQNLYFINAYWVGYIALYTSLILSIVSMMEYFISFSSTYTEEE